MTSLVVRTIPLGVAVSLVDLSLPLLPLLGLCALLLAVSK